MLLDSFTEVFPVKKGKSSKDFYGEVLFEIYKQDQLDNRLWLYDFDSDEHWTPHYDLLKLEEELEGNDTYLITLKNGTYSSFWWLQKVLCYDENYSNKYIWKEVRNLREWDNVILVDVSKETSKFVWVESVNKNAVDFYKNKKYVCFWTKKELSLVSNSWFILYVPKKA